MAKDKKRIAWNKGKKMRNYPQCGFKKGNNFGPNKTSFKKGHKSWHKGTKGIVKHSKSTRKKMSDTRKRLGIRPPVHSGKTSHLWKGGISFESYSVDWTRTLKRSIRERDRYTCQLCGALQADEAFCVHHIDYEKKNCDPKNLITLCRKCHTKTNHNRKYWINYFKQYATKR